MVASVIIDISVEQLDRIFEYLVPKHLEETIKIGSSIKIPFGRGNRLINGYVIDLGKYSKYDRNKLKEVSEVLTQRVTMDSFFIEMAAFIRNRYGSTMNQALKTVLPVKKQVRAIEKKYYRLAISKEEKDSLLEIERKNKRTQARVRLLEAFEQTDMIADELLKSKLNISQAILNGCLKNGIIVAEHEKHYRTPIKNTYAIQEPVILNQQQASCVEKIFENHASKAKPHLIHGITGSGKTEVYMEVITKCLSKGQQAIVLIPEIALTYQTVMRFYKRFGNRIAIMNSKLSQGERFDQIEMARKGEIDIMIGPRSALFTPFQRLGVVIIDEEHESSYKSDSAPKYHARDIAIWRGQKEHALVVLGSATPSIESYYECKKGNYYLYELTNRASENSQLAKVEIVDLKNELKLGNRTILSKALKESMENRLANNEQMMLFLNRRGFVNFVSCRSCGEPIKCVHCDVSLKAHNDGMLHCHYCDYKVALPSNCPKCTSPYIGGFGLGTQKVEAFVQKTFPNARILRMDYDTTRSKDSYEKILSAFANHEADILIGTQMIVKGHDFPNVTLVGILAADLSLNSDNYTGAEKTFQLLTQAAGRAGRAQKKGEVIIQTYQPEHYAVIASKEQNYIRFYENEIEYRKVLVYPPIGHLLTIQVIGEDDDLAQMLIESYAGFINTQFCGKMITIVGPSDEKVAKIKDLYRKNVFVKCLDEDVLLEIKNAIEEKFTIGQSKMITQFDIQ